MHTGKNRFYELITEENDAVEMMTAVKLWYELNMNMSPIPIIINKAINTIGKDFCEVLEVLNPEKKYEVNLGLYIQNDKTGKKDNIAEYLKNQQRKSGFLNLQDTKQEHSQEKIDFSEFI